MLSYHAHECLLYLIGGDLTINIEVCSHNTSHWNGVWCAEPRQHSYLINIVVAKKKFPVSFHFVSVKYFVCYD